MSSVMSSLLTGICTVGAGLSVVVGLILLAVNQFTDSSGGQSYAKMVACFIAAAAFGAAAVVVGQINFNIGI